MKNIKVLATIAFLSISLSGCALGKSAKEASDSNAPSIWQEVPETLTEDSAASSADEAAEEDIAADEDAGTDMANDQSTSENAEESIQESADPYTVSEEASDLYVQYGAYYYSVPDESTDVCGVLYKGSDIHTLGTVDTYQGKETSWKGTSEKWYQVQLNDGKYFVPSEYLAAIDPYEQIAEEAAPSVEPAAPEKAPETAQAEAPSQETPVTSEETKADQEEASTLSEPAPEAQPEAPAEPAPVIDYTTYVDQVATSAENDTQKRYRELSKQYDTTGVVSPLISVADVSAFNNYYSCGYSLDQLNQITQHGFSYIENDDGTYTSYLGDMPQHSRESVITLAINTFGVKTESDPYQTIYNTCARVRSKMAFNYGYEMASCTSAIGAGQGVCVHYSAIAYILLNAEGIPTRMVDGYRNGRTAHQWNQCFINGQWVTVDFCIFSNKSISPNGVVSGSYLGQYKEANLFNH